MMRDSVQLLRWTPWVAGGALGASLAAAGWAYMRDHDHGQAIEHERSLIFTAERLLSAVKDIETGERGFIITGQETYLQPYEMGRVFVAPAEARLRALASEEAESIAGVVDARVQSAETGVAAYRERGAAAAAAHIDSGRGKALMDQVRAGIAELQRRADERIAATVRAQRSDDLLRIASTVGLLVSFGVLAVFALLRRRQQQASQRLFEGVMENAPIGLGILDTSLRIRHINHALSKMSERALSAETGMEIWEVIPQLRDTLEDRLQRVLQGGRAANAEVEAASNTHAEQVRSYQANFYPLRAGGGTVEGVGMVIMDVTARNRAERAMRESEERFRSLVEANSSMMWTTDAEGAFLKPQPAWMRFTGQSEKESLGWGRLACLHPDDLERTTAAWQAGRARGHAIVLENRLRRFDGAWRHMSVSIVPVREEDGSLREWVGSHTDITDRKEAELALATAKEAAESANKAKSAFLANMSHELRTPLSAVIGYSEMLEEEAEEKNEVSMLADLGKIKSNAKHLLGLINDVLDLSKVEANKMDLYAEDIDVAAFVQDAASTVDALIARKSNTLVIDVGESAGTVHTDAVKLRQCLFNLLSNAAKFTENGSITLTATRVIRTGSDWIEFTIQDTGIGMTPEQLERLFQRFSQADETTTRKFGGTGLGLALSRAFAVLLGGDITVESTEGVGTRFTLRLPTLLPEREAKLETSGTGATQAVVDQGGTAGDLVLVIDDEASQRDLMTRFLHRQGFRVEVAANGGEGLDLARACEPRVILLDVMMPGMDGWSVLKALKADQATMDIPVVMVSFVADAGLGTALGAAAAVPKPVDWGRLKSLLDGLRDEGGDVLVVDDDADARHRLRAILEENNWVVREATDCAEALERLTNLPAPHVILLDLTMPVMDGFAFLHRLRTMPGLSNIPVLVLSARDISAGERVQLSEADRIVTKEQITSKELTAEIRALEGDQIADRTAH